jgi:hypothetical protein
LLVERISSGVAESINRGEHRPSADPEPLRQAASSRGRSNGHPIDAAARRPSALLVDPVTISSDGSKVSAPGYTRWGDAPVVT